MMLDLPRYTSWIVISIQCFSHILVSHFCICREGAPFYFEANGTSGYEGQTLQVWIFNGKRELPWAEPSNVTICTTRVFGKREERLNVSLLAACCRQYSHFNNSATFLILKQTRKSVKNCHTCNKVYHIKICKKNGSCSTQEGDEKSMQHEENMRRVGGLEGWA